MGKDPAVLFYTSDFLTGTAFFTKAQRGEYITLLCEQHQLWSIPEGHMIEVCGSLESVVAKKFKKDKDGSWYNIRMREETEKRKKYADSRRKNIGSRWDKNDKPLSGKKIDVIHMNNICNTHVDTYGIHMENENEDENKGVIEYKKEDIKQPTGSELIFDEFRKKYPGTKRGNSTEYENFCKKHRDHCTVLSLLLPALINQSAWRVEMSGAGMFVPEWKNLQTWINQRCWEMEKPVIEKKNNDLGNRSQSGRKLNEYEIGAASKYDGL